MFLLLLLVFVVVVVVLLLVVIKWRATERIELKFSLKITLVP